MRRLSYNSNYYKLVLKALGIAYGADLQLKGCPIIVRAPGGRIAIGERVTIVSSAMANLIGLYSRTILCARAEGASIAIGDDVGISGATIYARNSIYIGDHTMIGGNCKILDNDFHPLDADRRNAHCEEAISSAPIHIGRHCFIGCNAIVLKGTELGDGCVVGAGAVVSGRFAPNTVIAGNPGRALYRLGEVRA